MRAKLRKLGAPFFSEDQKKVLQPTVRGQDVLGTLPPGREGAATFLAPLLDRLGKESWPKEDQVLVLEPTRHLAEQSYLVANQLRCSPTRVALVYGDGSAQAWDSQRTVLRTGADLIVGTPGRVAELVKAELLWPKHWAVFALHEAEQLLSKGRQHGTMALLQAWSQQRMSPKTRQLLVFSGKARSHLEEDLSSYLQNPFVVDLVQGRLSISPEVKHQACEIQAGATRRARVVAWLLEERLGDRGMPLDPGPQRSVRRSAGAIVFVQTRADVVQLCGHAMLRQRVVALHGEMSAEDREEALTLFRASPELSLVTTDMAVRGTELPQVELVLHASLPLGYEAYARRLHFLAPTSREASSDKGQRRGPPPGQTEEGLAQEPASILIFNSHNAGKSRDLERALGKPFHPLPPPDEGALLAAAMAYISRELRAAVTHYDADAFLEDASQQLELHGSRIFAAALALLERRSRGEDWVSPLSGRLQYTPLLFVDPHLEKLRSRKVLLNVITRSLQRAQRSQEEADGGDGSVEVSSRTRGHGTTRLEAKARIGRVELTSKGWIADVHRVDSVRLLQDKDLKEQGITILPVAQIPEVLQVSMGAEQARRRRFMSTPPRPKTTLAERRQQQRLDFLYPAGRRAVQGPYVKAGKEDSTGKPMSHKS